MGKPAVPAEAPRPLPLMPPPVPPDGAATPAGFGHLQLNVTHLRRCEPFRSPQTGHTHKPRPTIKEPAAAFKAWAATACCAG